MNWLFLFHATSVHLHYDMYKNIVKLTTFKGGYNQVARMAKINAGEHILCIGHYDIHVY